MTPRLLVIQPPDPRWKSVVLPVGCVHGQWLVVKLTLVVSAEGEAALDPDQDPLDMDDDVDMGLDVQPGERIEVAGLGAVRIPHIRPIAAWTDPELELFHEVALACDAVQTAGEGRRLALVFHGALPSNAPRMRVVVALEEGRNELGWPERLADRARAHVAWAAERGEGAGDEDELTLERLALASHPAEPLLPLERYAAIAAELAEGAPPRAQVLARGGLDEREWLLEERGWLERMAEASMRGDTSLAERFGELFVAAQDQLQPPEELDDMLHDYVALSVRIDAALDPGKVLERWQMSLSAWLRLERHWQRRADAEPHVAAELSRLLDEERARVAAEEEP